MSFKTPGQFPLQKHGRHNGMRQLAVTNDFVNCRRRRGQRLGDDASRRREFGIGWKSSVGRLLRGSGWRQRECKRSRPAVRCVADFAKNVLGGLGENGALPEQVVSAPCPRIEGRTGNGKNVPSLLKGEPGGDQRSRPQRRFNNDDAARNARYEPVAPRKMTRLELRSDRHLRNDEASLCNLRLQAAMFRWIDDIHAAGDDRDGSCRQ
jgi:hypothetical protein